jgi:uncharacterized protein (TIGR03435 family)
MLALAMKVLALVALLGVCSGQSFEVASIRPHQGEFKPFRAALDGMQLTSTASVYNLIMFAYNLDPYEIAGIQIPNPSEPKEFYDISARAPGNTPPTVPQMRKMFQTLLEERFQLKFHHEMRETNVYGMVVAKSGPKLRESAEKSSRVAMDSKNITFTGAPISMLTQQLSVAPGMDRPVLDKTGLSGNYDFQLAYKLGPEGLMGSGGESIFTAIEEQLGLKLERQKAVIEVLVVDSVQKPSEN